MINEVVSVSTDLYPSTRFSKDALAWNLWLLLFAKNNEVLRQSCSPFPGAAILQTCKLELQNYCLVRGIRDHLSSCRMTIVALTKISRSWSANLCYGLLWSFLWKQSVDSDIRRHLEDQLGFVSDLFFSTWRCQSDSRDAAELSQKQPFLIK